LVTGEEMNADDLLNCTLVANRSTNDKMLSMSCEFLKPRRGQ
jgi:hypothetical protein